MQTQIVEPSHVYNQHVKIDTSTNEHTTNISIDDNPIRVIGNKVKINGDLIQINKYYEFVYKGKKHLLYRPSKKVTEIYRVK